MNTTIKKIKWKRMKGGRVFEHMLEGFVDDKLAFVIEGGLALSDMRAMNAAPSGGPWIGPKHYKLTSTDDKRKEAKAIAHDLLNDLNVDIHKANADAWIAEGERTAKLIEETEAFLASLKDA